VLRAVGSDSPVEHIDLPVDDPKVRRPDTTLAEQLLGWRPRVAWAEGLERTVEWFRQAQLEDAAAGPDADDGAEARTA
jgi:dTDP-glucose 4,6-dehydratase